MAHITSATMLFLAVGLADAAPSASVTIHASTVTHTINPLFLGCHSDSGFAHQPRGLYAQMVVGASFEPELPDAGYPGEVPHNLTCVGKCDFAGHCCVGDVASYRQPSCSMGCTMSAFLAVDACQAECMAISRNQSCDYRFRNHTFELCQVCPVVDGVQCKSPHVQECLDGCAYGHGGAIRRRPPSWRAVLAGGVPDDATVALDRTVFFHGNQSMHLAFGNGDGDEQGPAGIAGNASSSASAGVANRGLGAEGLYFVGGKPYEGYFFARAGAPVAFSVRIEDYTTGTVLAEQRVPYAPAADGGGYGDGTWTQLHFSLTPSRGTSCVGIDPATPTNESGVDCGSMGQPGVAGHVCVRCGGQLVVALASPGGDAHVDFVHLQPGK